MKRSSGSAREFPLPIYDRRGSEYASIVVTKEVAKFQTKIGAPNQDLGGSGEGGLNHHVAIFRTHPYLRRPLLTAVLNRGARAGAKRRSVSVVISHAG